MMKIKEKLCEQSGSSAVEFAILLVFLVMLLFGIVEFSLILYNQAVITNASREGARVGIRWTGDDDIRIPEQDIRNVVIAYCDQYLITAPPTKSIGISFIGGAKPGNPITVRVDYRYDFFVLPWIIPDEWSTRTWNPGIDLSARTIMRLE